MNRHAPSRAPRRLALAPALAGALLLAAGCASQTQKEKDDQTALPPPPKPDRELKVLAERAGTLSRVTDATRLVVPAGEEAPELPGIPVDEIRDAADRPTLTIVWALGEKPSGGFGVDIAQILLFDRTLVVRGRMIVPGPDEMATAALTYPYHAVAVPDVSFDRVVWQAIRPRYTGGRITEADDGSASTGGDDASP